ncbi:hypothetical protein [Actinoplanes sp. NPDC026619]|uniref:hypothetical protein n=1 Tax=Actinoplanes sp. NPDC026619 TaxID=3155798 RepID=UPI00340C9533
MILTIAFVTFAAGFLAGLLSFKKSNQFCDRHGVTRLCPLCPSALAHASLDEAHH